MVSIGVMVSAAVAFTMTDAPVLKVSQDGATVTAEWTAVNGADGYVLVYPPYPEFQPVSVLDLGSRRSHSIRLGELDSYAMADEEDVDGDGTSGRVNYVWDPEHEQTVLGRFGLKANSPSLRLQAAAAYHNDIGVTSPVFVEESSTGQVQDDLLEDDPEIDEETLQDATFYIQRLGVPARRNVASPEVQRGQMVFARGNCHGCHVPVLKTGDFPVVELANQVIRPYTDMLLHDMGPGLADSRPDFLATGSEWRTPPLWGIGLTKVVNGHTSFLHDGRARDLLEAIMWHGGEAEQSRLYVENLSKLELDALLAFLNSL